MTTAASIGTDGGLLMAEAMAYVEVPGYGTLIPISEVERVVNERDRYQKALEEIAAWGANGDPRWHHVRMFARVALDG